MQPSEFLKVYNDYDKLVNDFKKDLDSLEDTKQEPLEIKALNEAVKKSISETYQVGGTSPKRGDGGSTNYYSLPKNATELKHLIRHKNMGHAIGEAFCALYKLNDNGEYKRNLTKALYYIQSELDWMEGK